jgi:hypothetical protein
VIVSILVDQLDDRDANIFIDAWTFLDRGWCAMGSANGLGLLLSLTLMAALRRREAQADAENPAIRCKSQHKARIFMVKYGLNPAPDGAELHFPASAR